jgi:hypothetical protein
MTYNLLISAIQSRRRGSDAKAAVPSDSSRNSMFQQTTSSPHCQTVIIEQLVALRHFCPPILEMKIIRIVKGGDPNVN